MIEILFWVLYFFLSVFILAFSISVVYKNAGFSLKKALLVAVIQLGIWLILMVVFFIMFGVFILLT